MSMLMIPDVKGDATFGVLIWVRWFFLEPDQVLPFASDGEIPSLIHFEDPRRLLLEGPFGGDGAAQVHMRAII